MHIRSLVNFHSFEGLNDAFEVQFFSGLHFYTLSKTLIARRAMQLISFKVETLLNNAFKHFVGAPSSLLFNPDAFGPAAVSRPWAAMNGLEGLKKF